MIWHRNNDTDPLPAAKVRVVIYIKITDQYEVAWRALTGAAPGWYWRNTRSSWAYGTPTHWARLEKP